MHHDKKQENLTRQQHQWSIESSSISSTSNSYVTPMSSAQIAATTISTANTSTSTTAITTTSSKNNYQLNEILQGCLNKTKEVKIPKDWCPEISSGNINSTRMTELCLEKLKPDRKLSLYFPDSGVNFVVNLRIASPMFFNNEMITRFEGDVFLNGKIYIIEGDLFLHRLRGNAVLKLPPAITQSSVMQTDQTISKTQRSSSESGQQSLFRKNSIETEKINEANLVATSIMMQSNDSNVKELRRDCRESSSRKTSDEDVYNYARSSIGKDDEAIEIKLELDDVESDKLKDQTGVETCQNVSREKDVTSHNNSNGGSFKHWSKKGHLLKDYQKDHE